MLHQIKYTIRLIYSAERQGFEPWMSFTPCHVSSVVPSATRPSLQNILNYLFTVSSYFERIKSKKSDTSANNLISKPKELPVCFFRLGACFFYGFDIYSDCCKFSQQVSLPLGSQVHLSHKQRLWS